MMIESALWIYWLLCGVAAAVIVAYWQKLPLLLSPAISDTPPQKTGYISAVSLAWGATLLAAVGYILLTRKEIIGPYQLPDLAVFTVLNGVLEQLMFVFWFLAGCLLGRWLGVRSGWKIFVLGFLSYSVYSGFIHGWFWVSILPSHDISEYALVRVGLLLLMSLSWMWVFWRYRAIAAIICMHIFIDFFSIGHLHSTWFDAYQLAALR